MHNRILKLFALCFCLISFHSCKNTIEIEAENSGILDIINDPNKQVLSNAMVPGIMREIIDFNFLPVKIGFVTGSKFGYEVELTSGHNLYFTPNAESLNDVSELLRGRGHFLDGDPIRPTELPQKIKDVIRSNFNNAIIAKSIENGPHLIVLLIDGIILKFDKSGKLIEQPRKPEFDRKKIMDKPVTSIPRIEELEMIMPQNLDQCIKDDIRKFYPNQGIKKSFLRRDKTKLIILETNNKLVYDTNCIKIYKDI